MPHQQAAMVEAMHIAMIGTVHLKMDIRFHTAIMEVADDMGEIERLAMGWLICKFCRVMID